MKACCCYLEQLPVKSGGTSSFRPTALVEGGCEESVCRVWGKMMTLDPDVYIYKYSMVHKGYVNDKEIVDEKTLNT